MLAEETPDALALLWVSNKGEEKRFAYEDIRRLSVKAANFFTAQGIGKDDIIILTISRKVADRKSVV